MGGFLGRNKERASGFWAVLDLDNYPRGQSFSIEESLELMDQLRSFLELDIHRNFPFFFLDFYSVKIRLEFRMAKIRR